MLRAAEEGKRGRYAPVTAADEDGNDLSGRNLMLPSRLWLAVPLVVVAVTLCACSTGSPGAGSSAGGGAPGGAAAGSAAASPPAAPAGSVSTDGVCGLLPISKVNSILKRSYTDSTETALPAASMADAAYCLYGTASMKEQFAIQVATSDPADAASTFNEATGGKLEPQSGIGDSALYASSFPELVVVWGQTAIAVGQSSFEKGDATITLDQLKTLATAVHAAG
ncbi:MAG: hypothetical protein ABJA11_04000 [Pseudolysinimonas sp.]